MLYEKGCINLQPFWNKYSMNPNRNERLQAIKMIVANKQIGSQEELLRELDINGYKLTQATLSRDLKCLRIVKTSGANGQYTYVLPDNAFYRHHTEEVRTMSAQVVLGGFVSINFSGNIAVIRTRPGYASSLAYDIDTKEFYEIIGTIAGDDTILLVMREGVERQNLIQALSEIIPNINSDKQ